AAIRACGAAASTDSCVRTRAAELLSALLGAQRRALLKEPSYDDRGSHTLVAARALLQRAGAGDDESRKGHTIAYAADPELLDRPTELAPTDRGVADGRRRHIRMRRRTYRTAQDPKDRRPSPLWPAVDSSTYSRGRFRKDRPPPLAVILAHRRPVCCDRCWYGG